MPNQVTHAFTVDVEEFFHVSAFEAHVPIASWDRLPSRVEASMDQLLMLLDEAHTKATFFFLGWLAERKPAIVRRLISEGHEVASHGFWHRRVTTQQHSEFREDIRRAKAVLEQIGGTAVYGYRAPTFSIISETEWALPILAEEGYRWDSSRFPIHRAGYGSPHVARAVHWQETTAGPLLEIPMTVVRAFGRDIPAAGGGWFRQFPFWLTTTAMRTRAAEGIPAVFYIHPWELDPTQPRVSANLVTRIRHYRGLSQTAGRIQRMLQEHSFGSIVEVFGSAFPTAFQVSSPQRASES